jgi:hypothetical protein
MPGPLHGVVRTAVAARRAAAIERARCVNQPETSSARKVVPWTAAWNLHTIAST